ncbi:CDGSH iron-sulfur domain-containing protein [Maritalea sp.]|uniref:CDGSH iron-sulfur domain-containing protein n=1 Tax=Maritalea sp. TaxID=2003361 RepID=UPI003EF4F9A3
MGTVESDKIAVSFDGKKCIHARRCVLGLPEVFNPGAKGQWIFPENAPAHDIARLVRDCPSGALTYNLKDGTDKEMTPRVNTARLWENGPVEYRGELQVDGQEPAVRAVLCRCGKSKNKPFCDNSHLEDDFAATSDVAAKEDGVALEARDGELAIKPIKDGPLMVSGNLEIVAGSGRKITTGKRFAMCRCGASKNKPFCDGSHKAIGFEAD